ncbi:MAG: Gfo/Idh/MocA family protein, partial [Burkholderiaceae bacterium]
GVFGCGMIAEFHLRGWQRIPEVEIVAFGDRLLSRAAERRTQFFPQAQVYADLPTLIQQARLDFIDILTPPTLHREHCLLAKEAGLHIICQKPLCDDLDDARELVAAMQDYPQLFAVHENHRSRPWFQRILQEHAAGFFGQVQFVRLEHLNGTAPAESFKLASGAGVLLEYGTHLVDMMIALCGAPERVYARAHRLNPEVRGESLVHAVYEYAQTTAVIEAGWKRAGLLQASALVQGDKGEAYYEGTMTRGETARFRLVRGGEVILDEARSPYDDYVESFYLFQRDCVAAMLNRGTVTQTGAENLRTLVSTFAAYQAIKEATIIALPAAV